MQCKYVDPSESKKCSISCGEAEDITRKLVRQEVAALTVAKQGSTKATLVQPDTEGTAHLL
jgi:hypothetical protein